MLNDEVYEEEILKFHKFLDQPLSGTPVVKHELNKVRVNTTGQTELHPWISKCMLRMGNYAMYHTSEPGKYVREQISAEQLVFFGGN